MNDDLISVGPSLERMEMVEPLTDRLVRITWKSGHLQIVDLAPALLSRRIYIPLRENDELFRSLHLNEYGTAIEWSDDLDFSAAWLSKLPSVDFDNRAFRDAMDDLGMSLEGMAAALDISRRQVADYRKEKPIPKSIAFATRYLLVRRERDLDHITDHRMRA